MKKTKKTIGLILGVVLLIGTSVLGTMAYLTSNDTVKNTFTVGNVAITLDEADVNDDGTVIAGANRVKANTYHLIPGHEYTKDPIIHVAADSEDCWLFVKLENGLKGIIAETTIEAQMKSHDWELVKGEANVYKRAMHKKSSIVTDIDVFDNFTLNPDAVVANFGDANITVTAYAIQADGFETADLAWEALVSK